MFESKAVCAYIVAGDAVTFADPIARGCTDARFTHVKTGRTCDVSCR